MPRMLHLPRRIRDSGIIKVIYKTRTVKSRLFTAEVLFRAGKNTPMIFIKRISEKRNFMY